MSLADIDRQQWGTDERRAQRAERRGGPHPDDVMPDVDRNRHLRIANGRPAFELADLPRSKQHGIPAVREDLISFCRQHPGRWVRYNAAGAEDSTPTALRHQVRRATGGFTRGFEAALRQAGSETPSIYVRYVPPIGGDHR
ncbi:hypothetical protein KNT89_gp47 [Gordonia phage Petra]|uniref:Uncharacterized protein n=3 Tax=root TaxID=1 RepID=A0A2U8UKN3_9CAUD|nr:hypothetical protein [Gordonia westfalica]YP_009301790.1 hypothetical protein BJD61_gp47 [Gordonia phage Obliviate]YP_009302884.1 hypothetical protein BJD58_gp48 [Gordonia phage UmaThurman]YP_010095441.1 hypothetical protein KNT89_gp47 [Gordonia phage Petra]YP_010101699.1 hypothetical protein KNU50_gp49 [Gordonia phage Walrus]QFG09677.1 hypothetical protein PBI_PIPP_53 [Gordonia phage Pipp]AMS03126.1 hypothetical protein SEA_OBLIVIATE_47 [Gordonia phage Obliviate]AMS03948.1 hypothetical p